MNLGPITVQATGAAGIYTDANPGLVLRLGVSLDVNLFEIIKINASGELRLNTTNVDRSPGGVTIGAKSFRLQLTGDDQDPRGHQARGVVPDPGRRRAGDGRPRRARSATFNLGPGDWVIDVHATADFFGLATMSVDGWINSKGHFDISSQGELVLGTRSFGLVGEFSFRVFLREEASARRHRPTCPGQTEFAFGVQLLGRGRRAPVRHHVRERRA